VGDPVGGVVTAPVDERPGRGFWVALTLGTPIMVYGAYGLVHQTGWPRSFAVARWLGAGLLLHDLVLVPIVVALVWAVGRTAPRWLCLPVRAGVLGTALIVAVAWPALRGYGNRPDNPTVHPLDYGSAVLTVLAILWAIVAAWSAVAWMRQARPRPNA
jgi:hypothetical protein